VDNDFKIEGSIDLNDVGARAQIDALMKYANEVLGSKTPIFGPRSSAPLAGATAHGETMQELTLGRYAQLPAGKAPSALGSQDLTILAAYIQLLSQAIQKVQELTNAESRYTPMTFTASGTGSAAGMAEGAEQILRGAQVSSSEVADFAYRSQPKSEATITADTYLTDEQKALRDKTAAANVAVPVDADVTPAEATIGKLQTSVETKTIKIHTVAETRDLETLQGRITDLQFKMDAARQRGGGVSKQRGVYAGDEERMKALQDIYDTKASTYGWKPDKQTATAEVAPGAAAVDPYGLAGQRAKFEGINASIDALNVTAARKAKSGMQLGSEDQRNLEILQEKRASVLSTIEALAAGVEGNTTIGVKPDLTQQVAAAGVSAQAAEKAQLAYATAQMAASNPDLVADKHLSDADAAKVRDTGLAYLGQLIYSRDKDKFKPFGGATPDIGSIKSTLGDALNTLIPGWKEGQVSSAHPEDWNQDYGFDYKAFAGKTLKSDYSPDTLISTQLRAAGMIEPGRKLGATFDALRYPAMDVGNISSDFVGSAAAMQEAVQAREHPEWATPADIQLARQQATSTISMGDTENALSMPSINDPQVIANLEKIISDRILNTITTALQNGEKLAPNVVQAGQQMGFLNEKGGLAAGAQGAAGINIERNQDTRALTDTQGAVDTRNANAHIADLRSQSSAMSRVGREALATSAAVGMAFVSMVKASDTLNFATSKLNQAMKSTGEYSTKAAIGFDYQATSLLKLSGDQVATTLNAMAYAKSLQMTNEEVAALTPRMADISAALGIDMQTAFKASSLALNGITTQMRRMGFYVQVGADGFVGLDDILKATAGVEGMAEVHGQTLTGALDRLRGTAALVGASFGDTLSPALVTAINGITNIVGSFANMSDEAKETIGIIAGVSAAVVGLIGFLGVLGASIAGIKAGLGVLGITGAAAAAAIHTAIGVGGATAVGAGAGATAAAVAAETAGPIVGGTLAAEGAGAAVGAVALAPVTAGISLVVGALFVAAAAAVVYYANKHKNDPTSVQTEAAKIKAASVASSTISWADPEFLKGAKNHTLGDIVAPGAQAPETTYTSLRNGTPYLAPELSADAKTAFDSMTDKMVGLEKGNLASSQALLKTECAAMISLAGTAADSIRPTVDKYFKEQSAANIKAANMEVNTQYAQIGMSDAQTQIDNLKKSINDAYDAGEKTPVQRAKADADIAAGTAKIVKAANADINTRYAQIGMTDTQVQIDNLKRTVNDEYAAGPQTPAMRAKADAVIKAETKKIEEGSTKPFAPISIEGTNTNALLPFIGSLHGGVTKPKPQEIALKLTWDGSSIRIDDKTWSSPQLASKMAAAVMKLATSMVKNASLGG